MRLIDADALKHKRVIATYGNLEKGLEEREVVYVEDIDNAPTIEAKPVVYAQWKNHWSGLFVCSNCKGYSRFKKKYCGDCGAQMGEGVKIPVYSMEDVPKIMEEMEK